MAVKQNLVPPDIFLLRYRQALSVVVAAIVRNNEPAMEAVVCARTPATVAEEDKEHFIQLALGEFKTLHPGNAIRFGTRPLELSTWQERDIMKGA